MKLIGGGTLQTDAGRIQRTCEDARGNPCTPAQPPRKSRGHSSRLDGSKAASGFMNSVEELAMHGRSLLLHNHLVTMWRMSVPSAFVSAGKSDPMAAEEID